MSVFGPGVGECVLLHVGNSEWVVIDSCIQAGTTEPVAGAYLKSMGVDLSSVKLILATHFHDDHIRGLSKLVEDCQAARFAMSGAMQIEQFGQLVLSVDMQNRLVRDTSSASEFAHILQTLKTRSDAGKLPAPSYASEGTCLFRDAYCNTRITALSPSAATITNAHAELAAKILTKGDVQRFKRLSPNDLSTALLVETDKYCLLLGADLENTPSESHGWKAVLSSPVRPRTLSHAFKIPHHGSEGSHHQDVWTTMIAREPVSIVTPYAALRVPIPTDDDVERIRTLSSEAYCTTWPHTTKPPRRPGVDGAARRATRTRRALNVESGHVRLRIDLADDVPRPPFVQLFGNAKKL
jgi:hypothetical protein